MNKKLIIPIGALLAAGLLGSATYAGFQAAAAQPASDGCRDAEITASNPSGRWCPSMEAAIADQAERTASGQVTTTIPAPAPATAVGEESPDFDPATMGNGQSGPEIRVAETVPPIPEWAFDPSGCGVRWAEINSSSPEGFEVICGHSSAIDRSQFVRWEVANR